MLKYYALKYKECIDRLSNFKLYLLCGEHNNIFVIQVLVKKFHLCLKLVEN